VTHHKWVEIRLATEAAREIRTADPASCDADERGGTLIRRGRHRAVLHIAELFVGFENEGFHVSPSG
jgi:hypothetical protein